MKQNYIISSVLFQTEIEESIFDNVNRFIEKNICQEKCTYEQIFYKKIYYYQNKEYHSELASYLDGSVGIREMYFNHHYVTKINLGDQRVLIPDDEPWVVYYTDTIIEVVLPEICDQIGVYLLRILRDLAYGVNEKRGGVFFHCAGAVFGNSGILIMGEKGRGKTTLLTNMLSLPAKIIANDRAFLHKKNGKLMIIGFPQAVRVAIGTYNGNPLFNEYFLKNAYDRKQELLLNSSFKYMITLDEMRKIFKTSYVQNCDLELILIPNIDLSSSKVEIQNISQKEKQNILESVCFTPNDESFSYSWIYEEEPIEIRIQRAYEVKKEILKNIPIYRITFGAKIDLKELNQKVKELIKIERS